MDGGESDTMLSSPLLACRHAKQSASEEEDDEVQVEPVTPLAVRNGNLRKPLLHTSASMPKLEAFRYSYTPRQQHQQQQQQQQEQQKESGRATLPRRSTDATPTAANSTAIGLGMSPSVLKLAASTSTPLTASRPSKLLKRSPTLLLGEEDEDNDSRGTGGLFDRFRFSESAPAACTLTRQLPF